MASDAAIERAMRHMKGHYSMLRARWSSEVAELYTEEMQTWPDTLIDTVMADVVTADDTPTIAALRRMASAHRPPSRTTYEPEPGEIIATPAEARAAMKAGILDYWHAAHPGEPVPANFDDLPGAPAFRLLMNPVKRAEALAIHGDRDPFAE